MSASFQVFERRHRRAASQPVVAIYRHGTISLNRAAHEALGRPAAVELLYDRVEQIMGLRAASPEVGRAYPVRAHAGNPDGPYLVAGRAFTKHFGVDTTASRRLPAAVVDGVLCIDLKQSGDATPAR